MPRRTKPPAKASNRSASTRNWKISRPISTSSINASATVCYGRKGMQFRVKLFPVAEMIYDRYKDLHLKANKVFPIKRYYKTMNMSLRHVARHAGLSFNPTMHMARHTLIDCLSICRNNSFCHSNPHCLFKTVVCCSSSHGDNSARRCKFRLQSAAYCRPKL